MNKHKRLTLRGLIALLGLVFIGIATVPVGAAEPDLLFGETHNYSVVLRGNGESIVYARIALTNNGDDALDSYSFSIPKLNVAEVVGYQIEQRGACSEYDYSRPDAGMTGQRPCLKYQEPDYTNNYYYGVDAQYQKLKFTNQGNDYTVTLPKPVEPEKQTGLIISYTGRGYVTETLGLYKFDFQTLQVAKRIKQANVAVDVDSDLIIAGKRAEVNYQTSAPANSGINSGAELSLGNKAAMDSMVGSIGSYGAVTKQAKNLAANETLSVKGKYAETSWRLHLGKILIGLFALAALVGLVLLLARISRRRTARAHTAAPETGQPEQVVKATPLVTSKQSMGAARLLHPLPILAGLASAVLVAVGSVLTGVLIRSTELSSSDYIAGIIFIVLIILYFLLAVFGPALWFGLTRKNWKVFLYILFWEFAWLIVFALLYQLVFRDLFGAMESPEIYPAYDSMEL